MNKHGAALLLAVARMAALEACAEGNVADVTDMQALRDAVRTDKKSFVASVLALTDAEAKKFWPAYDAFSEPSDMTNREKNVTLRGRDRPGQAGVRSSMPSNIAKDIILADETEVKARRTLYNRVMEALPAKKALRYLQLEAKIRAVQAYDIAQAIPLVK